MAGGPPHTRPAPEPLSGPCVNASGDVYLCPGCGTAFSSQSGRRRHQRRGVGPHTWSDGEGRRWVCLDPEFVRHHDRRNPTSYRLEFRDRGDGVWVRRR